MSKKKIFFNLLYHIVIILVHFSAMGTFLFESRLGIFSSNPPHEAQIFIENLQGLFRLMQVLMYSLPIYKIFPTKDWRQYVNYCDNVFRIGKSYVNKVILLCIMITKTELNLKKKLLS